MITLDIVKIDKVSGGYMSACCKTADGQWYSGDQQYVQSTCCTHHEGRGWGITWYVTSIYGLCGSAESLRGSQGSVLCAHY